MITINTSEIVKYKQAVIDGVEFGVRALSSAETLEIMDLQQNINEKGKNSAETLKHLMDMIFNAFDKPDQAREVMKGLPIDAIMDIYKRVMESE